MPIQCIAPYRTIRQYSLQCKKYFKNIKLDKTKEINAIWIIVMIIGTFILWASFPFWSWYQDILLQELMDGKRDNSSLASIGDSFNIINSLFCGIALGSIVLAIFIQNRGLKIQREDMEQNEIYLRNQDSFNRKGKKAKSTKAGTIKTSRRSQKI